MKTTFKLPLFTDPRDSMQRGIAEATRLSGRSADSILKALDAFVEQSMKNLAGVDRKSPMQGYAAAFEKTLARSVKTTGKTARDLLGSFFYPYSSLRSR